MVTLTTTSFVAAEPAPTPEEVQQAQTRWNEGKAFFDAGNFEGARVAFKQAFTIFSHPAFLQNLGEAELRCGRVVEAARHLSEFLRATNAGNKGQRELAKRSLQKASEKLGSLAIETNVDDAEVRVDDEIVGKSPLGSRAYFVEPGPHAITASKDGYLEGRASSTVAAGDHQSVFVALRRVIGAADEPSPKRAGSTSGSARGSSRADLMEPTKPGASSAGTTGSMGALHEPRTWVLLGGAALTVVAIAVGVRYQLQVNTDQTKLAEAQAHRNDLRLSTTSGCTGNVPADAVTSCRDSARYSARLPDDRAVRTAAFIGAGVLAVGVVSAYFLWPSSNKPTVLATPFVSPGAAGVFVATSF
ncbi:MAG TPA: PEGA domain-containing protein [Polyangiaceae bacterium]|nr:PEGA domain-containing protein [Polyangiaceae bacterium]